jgi:hypothetical protein
MTSVAQATTSDTDWRIVVRAGVNVGIVAAAGVFVFAMLSRAMAGGLETLVQSVLILVGGAVFAYYPSMLLRPRDVDGIATAATIGLLGSLVFTVVDTIVLRPINLYHWTWDAIGGGSGFWYVPVWWMGSAFLAWLGAWVVAKTSAERESNILVLAGQSVVIGVVVGGIIMATGILPFHSSGFALGFALGLALHVPLSGVMRKG